MGINVSREKIQGDKKTTRGCFESVSWGDLLGQVYLNCYGMSIFAQNKLFNYNRKDGK